MTLIYPNSPRIPEYESSLASLMPNFEAGQNARTEEQATLNFTRSLDSLRGGRSALETLALGSNGQRPGQPPAVRGSTAAVPTIGSHMSTNRMVSDSHQAAERATDPALTDYFANAGMAHQASQAPRTAVAAIDQAAPSASGFEYTSAGRPRNPDNGFLLDQSDPRYTGAMANATGTARAPAPATSQDVIPAGYMASARRSESGGNDQAANPNSSALGRYQFLEPTWRGLMRDHPDLGLTADGRTDPDQQERAMDRFTRINAAELSQAGIPVTPGTLYAAHFLGAAGARNVLTQDPNSPVSAYVDPGVIEANPQLRGQTVGQFAEWANSKGSNQTGGYQPPMASDAGGGSGGGMAGLGSGAQFELPPNDVMEALFRSETSRPYAIALAKAALEGRAMPAPEPIEINGQLIHPLTGEVIGDYRDQEAGAADYTDTQQNLMWRAEQAGLQPGSPEYRTFMASGGSGGMSISLGPDGSFQYSEGSAGAGGGVRTEAQGKDIGFYTRGIDAQAQLADLENNLTSFTEQNAGLLPLGIGNYARSPEFRQAKIAADSFLAAILRKDTGAAITPEEFALYGPMFLPVPGDDPGTIAMKRRARDVALLAIRSGLGTAEAVAQANEIALGLSAPAPGPTSAPPTATNSETGEVVQWNGQEWVPMQ